MRENKTYSKLSLAIIFYYCLVFILTYLIIFFKHQSYLPDWTRSITMFLPALFAVLFQKYVLKLPVLSSFFINFKINRYWFYPIFISILFVSLSYLVTYAFEPNVFKSFVEISNNTKIQSFSRDPIKAIFFIFFINIVIAPLLNIFLFLGEELGWRSFLSMHLGRYRLKGVLLSGLLWGVWHFPMIWYLGLNYQTNRFLGFIIFLVFCIFLNLIWTYWLLKCESVIPIAIAHGAVNWTAITFMSFIINIENYNSLSHGPTGLIGLAILALIFIPHLIYLNKMWKFKS